MTRRRRLALVLAALPGLGLALPARGDGLSPEEARVVEQVDARRDEALALLEAAVNIPSATQNLDGVRAAGRLFADEFDRIGFTTRWDAMPPEVRRAGHLIAEHPGTSGGRVLLIGHLDTVLEGRPFERRGSKAWGNGTEDMKGGDVVLLFALKALHAAGALDGRRVSVILTGDEEDTGAPVSVTRASMIELARRSDVALGFEAAVNDTATVARRGYAAWTLSITGRTAHSARVLRRGTGGGAAYEAARILDAFRTELGDEHGLSLNPSLILAGTEVDHTDGRGAARGKRNVIAGGAVVEGDLRFLSDTQFRSAQARMRAITARSLPRTAAELTFESDYPAMAPYPRNDAVLAVLDRASRDLGLGPVKPLPPEKRGAGDIAFVADLVPCLDGLGARGERSHTPEEWVDLDTLPAQIKRASVLIHRLTRPAPEAARAAPRAVATPSAP